VASTRRRVATASGANGVALALAVPSPCCPGCVFCIPLAVRLHLPGQGQPSCAALAGAMLDGALTWFPGRDVVLVTDSAYACRAVLEGLPGRVTFVGRLRGDAAVHDPTVPPQPKGQRGPKPKKGPRLLSPRAAANQADLNRDGQGPWAWQAVEALASGVRRGLEALRGPWDSPWSLRHMLQVLRRATLKATIRENSSDGNELQHSLRVLKNLVNSAA
jgi:hypothetical protein